MEQAKIDRINELARRVKAGEALTEEEQAERAALRREYIDSVKASLTAQLDNTYWWNPTAPSISCPRSPPDRSRSWLRRLIFRASAEEPSYLAGQHGRLPCCPAY